MGLFLEPGFRHLAAGVGVAIVLVLTFAVGQSLLSIEAPLPESWLNEAEQEELAELHTSWRPNEWVAGCLWEGRSSADIRTVLDAPSDATEWTTKTTAGREVSLLLSEEAELPSGSYREVEAPGAFCYVPDQ